MNDNQDISHLSDEDIAAMYGKDQIVKKWLVPKTSLPDVKFRAATQEEKDIAKAVDFQADKRIAMPEHDINEIIEVFRPILEEHVIKPLCERLVKEIIERELKPGGILNAD